MVRPRRRGQLRARLGVRLLQGAWPFGLVEAIWALVAVRRWRQTAAAA